MGFKRSQYLAAVGLVYFVAVCQTLPVDKNFTILSYDIHIDLKTEFEFDASYKVTFRPAKDFLDTIPLHAVHLIIERKSISVTELGSTRQLKINKVNQGGNAVTIQTVQYLSQSVSYMISMEYKGFTNKDAIGIFRSYYKSGENKKLFLATNLNPAFARNVFPCLDEPSQKSAFSLSIVHDTAWRVISNTPIKSVQKVSSTRVKTSFKEAQNLPTHLLAFVLGDFVELFKNETTKLTTWGLSSSKELLERAHSFASEAVIAAGTLTGVPAFWSNLNVVILPDLAVNTIGAGLLILGETPLTFVEGLPARYEQNILLSMAKYVSTQWAGWYIWPSTWRSKWMTSGYVALLQYQISDSIRPDWQLISQRSVNLVNRYLLSDDSSESYALNETTQTDADTDLMYLKGGSILLMVENLLNTSFWNGTRRFFRESTDNLTSEGKLLDILEKQATEDNLLPSGISLGVLVQSWTHGTGYPLVTVLRDYKRENISAYQTRFVSNFYDRQNITSDGQDVIGSWWIPIAVMTEKSYKPIEGKPRYWMAPRQALVRENVVPADEWLYFNVKRAGPFRVFYDVENWKKLRAFLNGTHLDGLPAVAKAQLISDALAMSRAGYGDNRTDTVFDALSLLSDENEWIVWESVLADLTFFKDRFRGSIETERFKMLLAQSAKKTILNLNFTTDPPTHDKKLMKETVFSWACWAESVECEKTVRPFFLEWLKNEAKLPPPDIFAAVMCTGLRSVKPDMFTELLHKSQTEKAGSLRRLYLSTLTCVDDPTVMFFILQFLIAEGYEKSDVLFFTEHLIENGEHVLVVLKILNVHYSLFRDCVRSKSEMIRFLKLLLRKINKKRELNLFRDIIKTYDPFIQSALEDTFRIANYTLRYWSF